MELKKGVFAMYRGKEYRASQVVGSRRVYLFTDDASEVANGFVRGPRERYEKVVGPNEVTTVYKCSLYTIYQGVRVQVIPVRNGNADLIYTGTDQADQVRKAGFEQIDKYSYMKVVPLEELEEVLIETSPIPGYQLPEEFA